MKRLLWIAWWGGVLFVGIVIACLPMAWQARLGPPFRSYGYLLPLRTESTTTIAVFGDTQKGVAAFSELAAWAKREGIDLAVHTGDLVSRADRGHFDLALSTLDRAALGVPVVVTPGNHDIKEGNGLFEKLIGPRQFAFRWGPVTVVVIDNSVGHPDEAAAEKLLAGATAPVLLFMHVPPVEAPAPAYQAKPAYAGFLKMIRKYKVAFVFSGHAHGYSRVESEGVTFISNGVGGDSDSWQFDQKAHLTIVEASPELIRAREISIDPVFSVRANFEHLAVGHVGEILLRRVWGIPGLLLSIGVLYYLFRALRKKRAPKEPEETDVIRKLPELEKRVETPFKFTSGHTSEPPDVVI